MAGLVFTNLARRKARAVATALGIALGVATIVALLSVGSGLKRTAAELVHLGQADLGIFQVAHRYFLKQRVGAVIACRQPPANRSNAAT